MNKQYNYVITSGWWCTGPHLDNRPKLLGDDFIRSTDFHHLWYEAINRFTSPKKILIVDSDSPIPPPINPLDSRLEHIRLSCNAGHATNHIGRLCGFSRGQLCGIIYALADEFDYWVYIEQDALIYGQGIIEYCISKMKGPFMFGNGTGTGQECQQSFMIIRKDGLLKYMKNFLSISASDHDISPELKSVISTSSLLTRLPSRIYVSNEERPESGKLIRKLRKKLIRSFGNFTPLPIGYGRTRPLDFDAPYFYFQHGSIEEIEGFKSRASIKQHETTASDGEEVQSDHDQQSRLADCTQSTGA